MGAVRWTPELMGQIEHAVRLRQRISLTRRGTEYVVVAEELRMAGNREQLLGYLPMTGETLTFFLDDIDALHIID